jgi:hypothetical protein
MIFVGGDNMGSIKPSYKKAQFLQLLFGQKPTAKGKTIWRASFTSDHKYSLWAQVEKLPDALLEGVVQACGGKLTTMTGSDGETSFAAVIPAGAEVEIACQNKSRRFDITHLRSLNRSVCVKIP